MTESIKKDFFIKDDNACQVLINTFEGNQKKAKQVNDTEAPYDYEKGEKLLVHYFGH